MKTTPLTLLISIVDRGNDKGVLRIIKEHDVRLHWCSLGCGTAHSEVMDFLGLDEPEKDLIFCVVDSSLASGIMRDINERLKLNRRGAGIMFTIPTGSINADALEYITTLQNNETTEVREMNLNSEYRLIVNVVSRGLSDLVMKAAVTAGATGGTIMRSRGVGPDDADDMKRMFFQPEKEIVLLVVKQDIAKPVMQAVCDRVGEEVDERVITFSLPITDVVGIYGAEVEA